VLDYFEAIVVGAFQGVTELFPVSSLGHSVLLPAVVGGRWAKDLDVSAPESPYLAFIVGCTSPPPPRCCFSSAATVPASSAGSSARSGTAGSRRPPSGSPG
jgi:hypothetical protein